MPFVVVFCFMFLMAVAAFIWLVRSPSVAALLVVLLFAFGALAWASFWLWFFRDGLAPGFVPSTGLEAMTRFASSMVLPGGICGLLILASVGYYLRRGRRTNDAA